MQRPASITIDRTRLMFGLSAVSVGLDCIECGKVETGKAVARHGEEFLRRLIAGETSDV